MGTKADTIIENLKLSTDKLSKFTIVQDKLSQFFLPKTYVIYERAKSNHVFNVKTNQLKNL